MRRDLFSLKHKVAVVTGGYQGIGKVVAGYLADAGADIVIFDLKDASDRRRNQEGIWSVGGRLYLRRDRSGGCEE